MSQLLFAISLSKCSILVLLQCWEIWAARHTTPILRRWWKGLRQHETALKPLPRNQPTCVETGQDSPGTRTEAYRRSTGLWSNASVSVSKGLQKFYFYFTTESQALSWSAEDDRPQGHANIQQDFQNNLYTKNQFLTIAIHIDIILLVDAESSVAVGTPLPRAAEFRPCAPGSAPESLLSSSELTTGTD